MINIIQLELRLAHAMGWTSLRTTERGITGIPPVNGKARFRKVFPRYFRDKMLSFSLLVEYGISVYRNRNTIKSTYKLASGEERIVVTCIDRGKDVEEAYMVAVGMAVIELLESKE